MSASNLYLLNVYQNKELPMMTMFGRLPDGQPALEESETETYTEEVLLFSQILTLGQNVRDDAAQKYIRDKLTSIIPNITRVLIQRL